MLKKCLFLAMIITFPFSSLSSADLKSVLPITNKILVVEFDEGHIDYFGINEDRFKNNVYYSQLNIEKALALNNYSITSSDDENYAVSLNPINIGRKSKGSLFNNIYSKPDPGALKTHWIYIELPFELKKGDKYLVELNDIASNFNEYEFIYDEFNLLSPSIHINQIGYVPDAPKYGYISQFMGNFSTEIHPFGALNLDEYQNNNFHLINSENDSIVFTGNLSLQQSKSATDFYRTTNDFTSSNMTRADVWECDFSEFDRSGSYKVVVEGIGCSYPFEISEDIYREPFNATSRAMFYQRAGIIQEIEEGIEYPKDYDADNGTVMKYYPNLKDSEHFDPDSGVGIVEDIWGWYHDAGDWDTYSSHYRVPMTLLALYDMKAENFGDGDINQKYKLNESGEWINEGNNNLPDILDEAKWLISYYKRAKDELIRQGYTDGGVPGYAGVDAGATDGKPSWQDKRVLALQGGDNVLMSYRYAALSAYLSICLDRHFGVATQESAEWLTEAETAYNWAVSNGEIDSEISDAKMEAAAALFRKTNDTKYQDFLNFAVYTSSNWGSKLWFNIHPWHYVATIIGLMPDDSPNLDQSLKQKCINDIKESAQNETVNGANSNGFRYGIDKDIIFLLGTFSVPHIYIAALAYEFTNEKKYLDACYSTADYCLGGNQMNLVRVTGLGENYERSVFHPDSWYLFDYNSQVYTNPILPGFTAYDMHKNGDWMQGNMGNIGNGWSWVGDEDYSRSTSFPHIDNFPDSEARFQNRFSIAGSEFTIHQNQIQAIFAYGYLCDTYTAKFEGPTRPEVELILQEGLSIPIDTTIVLAAEASENTSQVEYYYNWHYIGTSSDAESNFQFTWDLSKYKVSKGSFLITARAISKKGLESKPSAKGETILRILNLTDINGSEKTMGKFELFNNYPNPFNPITTIRYELADKSDVELSIYDVLGNHVRTLVKSNRDKGTHTVTWDGKDDSGFNVASGIYFQKLIAGSFSENKKMALLK